MMQVSRKSRRSEKVAIGSSGRAICDRSCAERPASCAARRAGFTLLEVLIALALIIMLMAGVYGFYVNTMKARDTAVRSIRDTLLMRALLEQIAEEIRHATDVVPDNMGFKGTKEELTFVRLMVPDMGAAYAEPDPMSEDPKPGQEDMARITYKLQWDEEQQNMDEDGTPVCYGLLRSQQSPIDPNPSFTLSAEEMARYEEESGFKLADKEETPPPVSAELIAPEIKYLKFEYFDGAEWRDQWQSAAEAQAPQGNTGAEGADGGTGDSGSDGSGDQGTGGEGGAGDGGTGGTGTGGKSGGTVSGGKSAGTGTGGTGGRGSTGQGGTGAGLANLGGGGTGSGGQGGQGYVLPQAIRITIGKVKVPRLKDEFDVSRANEEEELDKRTYHPDRWTITVYLRQADQSQLSSRKYGIENDISGEGAQTGEQTEGGGI